MLAVAVGLAAIYLLVLTSLKPGDIAIALVLGLAIAFGLRPRPGDQSPGRLHLRPAAVPRVAWDTLAEVVRGSWRVVRFCIRDEGRSGFVEIPLDGRTDADVALWGLITGEAPDEIVVDVDRERELLVVHLIDASDPNAVRARHRRDLERRRGKELG
jgi:multisubunit Na+/H+ antiporter MnhE subunit